MQAIICKDKYDPPCDDLITQLAKGSCKVFLINSLSEFDAILPKLNQEQPCLLYYNSLMRFDGPAMIFKKHLEVPGINMLCLKGSYYTGEIVSFFPTNIIKYRDSIITRQNLLHENSTYLKISYPFIYHKIPKIDPPRIFVYTHNHDTYLRLSLNSLFYSIDKSVPVAIFLNQATDKVKKIVLEFKEKYPEQIEILESKVNVVYSAVNLMIQWYQPKYFVIWEDDFILPPRAKELFPLWAYQFAHRLQYFDLVGWSITTDNIPLGRKLYWYPPYRKDEFPGETPPYEWVYARKNDKYYTPFMGQALAMTADFYRSCRRIEQWQSPIDVTLHEKATHYCTPALRGYHIGWNQEMDGNEKVSNLPTPPTEVEIISDTGEKRTLRLCDL